MVGHARLPYPTDVSDAEWTILEPLLPAAKRLGRRGADLRQVVNAIRYVTRSGAQWRMVPRDFVPGALPGPISVDGAKTAPGNACTTQCAPTCTVPLVVTRSPPPLSWTVSPSRRSNAAQGCAASMAPS